jgi:hypothetical protein
MDVIEGIRVGNNLVRILEIGSGPCADKYIVKVPCVGTAARWQECNAYMLRSGAHTMCYIFKNIAIPCPEVLGFSDHCGSGKIPAHVISAASALAFSCI